MGNKSARQPNLSLKEPATIPNFETPEKIINAFGVISNEPHIDENKENLSKTPTVDGSENLEGYKGIIAFQKLYLFYKQRLLNVFIIELLL